MPLPPAAARCPSCGHRQGEVIAVELGGSGAAPPPGSVPKKSRRRDGWLLAGVVVLVVGALAFAGRGGNDGEDGAEEAEASEQSEESDPGTTSTTRRRPPRTTTSTTTTLPPLLLGQETGGLQLLVSASSDYVVVDLDTGLSVDIEDIDNSAQVIPTDGGFFAGGGPASVRFYAAPYDSEPVRIGGGDAGSGMVASRTAGRVWVIWYNQRPVISEYDVTGTRTAGPIDLPQFNGSPPAVVDDGLVFSLRGGIYVMNPDDETMRRIGYGEILGASGSSVASIGCDEAGLCDVRLINVSSGAARPVDLGDADLRNTWYEAKFSPDESMVVLTGHGPMSPVQTTMLVDVESGDVVPITIETRPDYCCSQGTSWSRDGRWLFWSDANTVYAWERGAEAPIEFRPGQAPFGFVTVLG